jgi:hypothetical protein
MHGDPTTVCTTLVAGDGSEQSTRAQVRTRTGERVGRKRNACVAGCCWVALPRPVPVRA